jgi:DNA (cytosine-5)-methyltransferase 1
VIKIKILNLYAGIGGNRKLWGNEHEVTAVENDPIIASVYQKNFPDDTVIVGDAKDYLLNHFQEFDFIWASPPCPTHSRMRTLWKGDGNLDNKTSGSSFKLPDMDLYSIIIFLQHFSKCDWVVENVISYYDPLIRPTIIDNHYFWSNKTLQPLKKKSRNILEQDIRKKAELIGMPFPEIDKPYRYVRSLINNCVRPEVGKHLFDSIFRIQQHTLIPTSKKENGR